MKKRNPRSARMLRHKLKWLYELDAAGDKAGAKRVFESLPETARGVLSLLLYAGRFAGWRTRKTKRRLADLQPRNGRRVGCVRHGVLWSGGDP